MILHLHSKLYLMLISSHNLHIHSNVTIYVNRIRFVNWLIEYLYLERLHALVVRVTREDRPVILPTPTKARYILYGEKMYHRVMPL